MQIEITEYARQIEDLVGLEFLEIPIVRPFEFEGLFCSQMKKLAQMCPENKNLEMAEIASKRIASAILEEASAYYDSFQNEILLNENFNPLDALHELVHAISGQIFPVTESATKLKTEEIEKFISIKSIDEGLADFLSIKAEMLRIESGIEQKENLAAISKILGEARHYPRKELKALMSPVFQAHKTNAVMREFFAFSTWQANRDRSLIKSVRELGILLKAGKFECAENFFFRNTSLKYALGLEFMRTNYGRLPEKTGKEKILRLFSDLPSWNELKNPKLYLKRS